MDQLVNVLLAIDKSDNVPQRALDLGSTIVHILSYPYIFRSYTVSFLYNTLKLVNHLPNTFAEWMVL